MKLFTKAAALVLCLALVAGAAGCSGAGNTGKTAGASPEQSGAKSETGADQTIVATVNGENIYKSDYNDYYDQTLQSYYDYTGQAPFDESDAQATADFKNSLLDEMVMNKVIDQKVKELGFDKLTDAQKTQATTDADDYIKEYKDSIRESIQSEGTDTADPEAAETPEPSASSSPSPSSSADIEAKVQEQLKSDLDSYGLTEDKWRQMVIDSNLEQAKIDALMNSIMDKVTVADADLQKWYDDNLKTQQDEVKNDPTQYETHIASDVALYVPEGIVRVKQILLKVNDAKSETAQGLYDEGKVEEAFDVLAREFSKIQSKAEEVLKKVNAKKDFEGLMEQYNEDEGMKEEPQKSQGYTIVPGSSTFLKEFTDAALKLKNVGDTSGLVKTVEGYHILMNVGTVTPGPVAFETVKDKIKETVLADSKDAAWEKQQADWKAAAKVTLFKDRLKDDSAPQETAAPSETASDEPASDETAE
jgi:hypothetical protein